MDVGRRNSTIRSVDSHSIERVSYMPAYVVVHATIFDHERFAKYAVESRRTIATFGGKVIARGEAQRLHGHLDHPWGAILEFPSKELAIQWFNSDPYQSLVPLRDATSKQSFAVYDAFVGN